MIRYCAAPKTANLLNRQFKPRLLFVMAVLALCFSVILARLMSVAVIHYNVGSQQANPQDAQMYKRASIVDRNGMLLAVNLTTASLYADPKVVMDPQEAAQKLHQVFPEMDPKKIQQKLESKGRFVWIKRNLTPVEQEATNRLGIPGLYFREAESRVYPHGRLFSHLLGFTSVDGRGIAGIEKEFDGLLKESAQHSTGGEPSPLELSIDVRVQDVLYEALANTKEKYSAFGAGGLVMDANTGEVIAMVSLPDFDPHNPSDSTNLERFNSATLGVYEMGSTFKTFNMALAFESGKVDMDDSYDVSKPIRIARFSIRDYHPVNGMMTVPEIFIHSSNIGCAQMVMEVGEQEQKAFLNKLGLLGSLAIEIPEKALPLYPENWSKISAMTISYGHGIAVSPVHLTQSIAAMVNGGKLHQATVLKKTNKEDAEYTQVISKETSDKIRKLMRYVVEHGTGGGADVAGYLVGGKTGSADKPQGGKYGRNSLIASFVGAFPMHSPKYVVFVMVDDPQRSKQYPFVTGGVVAAPIMKEVVEQIAPILGIAPVDELDQDIRQEFWYDNEEDKARVASL